MTQSSKFEKVRRLASTEIIPSKHDKFLSLAIFVLVIYETIRDIASGEDHWLYGVVVGVIFCILLAIRGFRRTFSWLYTDQPDKPDKPGDQR